MESLFIRDFRLGLDTRRSELTQRPGTLEVLTNGFINQGGEIENRKAFVRTAQIANSFGLQATSSGLYTFGSASTPGGYPLNIGTVGKPIYVNYQQLKHPQDLFDGTTNVVAMTEVVHSSQYRGKAWVIAKFGSNGTYGYYDGALVYDFVNGLVLAGKNSLVNVAAAITALVNRQGTYTAVQLPNPNDYKVNITGPSGVKFESATGVTSAAGTIAIEKSSEPTSPVASVAASGSFEIIAGSSSPGTNKITAVKVNGVTITGGAVNWTTSNEETARLLALSIATTSTSPDYTAESSGQVVTIYAKTSAGTTPNGYTVSVEAAGNVCVGALAFMFTGTTFQVDTVTIDGVNVLTTTYAYPGTHATITACLAAIVADINANNTTYLAYSFGPTLFLSKRTTSSADVPLNAYVTLSGVTTGGGGVTQVDPRNGTALSLKATLSIIARDQARFTLRVTTEGGTPPYSFDGLFRTNTNYLSVFASSQIDATNWDVEVVAFPETLGSPIVYAAVKDTLGRIAYSNNLTIA